MTNQQCAPARFTFLLGDVSPAEYGGKWISQKLNNGDFDYWLVLELVNMEDACGDEAPSRYSVSVSAVSPGQAGSDNLKAAADCCGIPARDVATPEQWVELLHSYGVSAHLWDKSGNNYSKLITTNSKFNR